MTTFPRWMTYPGPEWDVVSPEEAGFDPDAFAAWSTSKEYAVGGTAGDEPGDYGALLVRGGRVVQTWGNPDHRWSSASVGKLFVKLALQLAADHGRIERVDDRIRDYWIGDGREDQGTLNHPRKHMDAGHNAAARFVHLVGGHLAHDSQGRMVIEDSGHVGGFPVSNGEHWRMKQRVPDWAEWHDGDGDTANYAHVAPGTQLRYASGGVWRLSQALTHIWDADLKDILDEHIMSRIGIAADSWDWLSGRHVRFNGLYPADADYATFCDEPYEIRGHTVRGGGGWVVMTPKDFARVGLLLLTGGWWDVEQLIRLAPFDASPGHTGGGGSVLQAYRSWDTVDLYCVYAQVTAAGFNLIPHKLDLAGLVVGEPAWADSSPDAGVNGGSIP